MSKKQKEEKTIVISPINRRRIKVTLMGDGTLIHHKFSEKAKKEMEEKTQGKARTKKAPRNPKQEYEDSMHKMPNGKGYGIPTRWIKAAMVGACRHVEGISMTLAKGLFYIRGESDDDYALIKGKPSVHEDTVSVGKFGSKVCMVRYRGEFKKWETTIVIDFWENQLTLESLLNLLNIAGFACGIGEMRPEKTGLGHGTFHMGRILEGKAVAATKKKRSA